MYLVCSKFSYFQFLTHIDESTSIIYTVAAEAAGGIVSSRWVFASLLLIALLVLSVSLMGELSQFVIHWGRRHVMES